MRERKGKRRTGRNGKGEEKGRRKGTRVKSVENG